MKKTQEKKRTYFLIVLANVILVFLCIIGISIWHFTGTAGQKGQRTADASIQSREQMQVSGTVSADLEKAGDTGEENREKAEEEQKTKTLKLSMVGDVLLHASVSKSGRQKDGTYNYDLFFKHVKKKIKSSDVAIVNEEVLLAGTAFGITGYPKFNGRFEVGDAIAKAGFDVVLHATNHSMDKGKAGLLSDLAHWKKAHPKLKVTGMYRTRKEASKITYIKRNGIKLAILNYTYGTNGLPLPSDMPFAVNLLTESKVKKDVREAKKHADFVVVCPHWGTEYKDGIDAYQKKWTRLFLKLKVDLVIGAHPHVIEPVKWVSDGKGHKMLVYYSLGNYINSTARKAKSIYRQYLGGMADVTIEKKADGSTRIKKAAFIPLITHYSKDRKVTTYFFKDYNAKKAVKNRLSERDKYFSYRVAKKHFKKVISKRFLKFR